MIAEGGTSGRERADGTLQRLVVYHGEKARRCAPTLWKLETMGLRSGLSDQIYRTTQSDNTVQERSSSPHQRRVKLPGGQRGFAEPVFVGSTAGVT